MFLVSSCICLCSIRWSQALSREWKCSWSSADRLLQLHLSDLFFFSGKSSNSCQDANCKYCPYIDASGNIFSTTTKKRHNAKFNVCCNSSNLIYCLTCGTCEKQYVGMTKRKLKQCLYEHLRNIRQGNLNDPIGRHFSKVPHNRDPSKVKVHVLSFITHPPDSRTALNMRLRFELDWIHRLRTTLPRGLNAMD